MNEKLAADGLLLARDIAPKRTGNLAFNAISMRYLPNGFKIFYDGQKAFYLEFLQEGTKYSSEHKGFIDMTATAISAHITAALNGHTNNLNSTRKRLEQWAEDTPQRQGVLVDSLAKTKDKKMELMSYSLQATVKRS